MHTQDTNSTKVCTKCGRDLPVTMFSRRQRCKDGLDTRCKECRRDILKEWRRDRIPPYTCAICGGPRKSPRSKICLSCCAPKREARPHRPKGTRSIRHAVDNGDGTHSVPLTQGQFARIDSADVPIIEGRSWCANKAGGTFYAMANLNGKGVLMHRIIVDARPGEIIDHMNGDGLDNRRVNLRKCTNSQNMANRTGLPSNNSTGYLGISRYKKTTRFYGRVNHHSEAFFTRSFPTAEEAARARDQLAKNIFGPYARLNFPDDESE